MFSSSSLIAFVNKVVLFLLVYAGFYLSVTSVLTAVSTLSGNNGSDFDLIMLGLVALVTVIGMAIGGHLLTKKGRAGWQVLATIAPMLAAFGALTVQATAYGVVLIAAFAPCLYLLVNPARIDGWTRSVLGIEDGAKVTSVLGASGAVLLVITDKISFSPCPYTFLGLSIAILLAGLYMMARGFSWKGKADAAVPVADPKHIDDVAPAVAVSAYFSLLSWALFPVIVIFASKQLAVLGSFGSGLAAPEAGIFSLVAFTAGAFVVAVLLLFVKRQAILRVAALVFLGILGSCIAILSRATVMLDGSAVLAFRLLSFGAIPGSILAMLGMPVPDVKGIAFHFWKGFMVVVGIVLLIAGIGFKIANADLYFMIVYLVVLGLAATPLVIDGVAQKTVEVHAR